MYAICYLSTASKDFIQEGVEKKFNFFAAENQKHNISGILLYNEGNVLQVLEGNKEALFQLYSKIKLDPRHHSIHSIYSKEIPFSIFSGYTTTFTPLYTQEEIKNIHRYIAFIQELDSPPALVEIVERLIASTIRF